MSAETRPNTGQWRGTHENWLTGPLVAVFVFQLIVFVWFGVCFIMAVLMSMLFRAMGTTTQHETHALKTRSSGICGSSIDWRQSLANTCPVRCTQSRTDACVSRHFHVFFKPSCYFHGRVPAVSHCSLRVFEIVHRNQERLCLCSMVFQQLVLPGHWGDASPFSFHIGHRSHRMQLFFLTFL